MRDPASILTAAAERFASLRHCKSVFRIGPHDCPVAVCAVGAVHLEISGSAHSTLDPREEDQIDLAVCLLAERLTGEEIDDAEEAFGIVTSWNDRPETVHADVLALLEGRQS